MLTTQVLDHSVILLTPSAADRRSRAQNALNSPTCFATRTCLLSTAWINLTSPHDLKMIYLLWLWVQLVTQNRLWIHWLYKSFFFWCMTQRRKFRQEGFLWETPLVSRLLLSNPQMTICVLSLDSATKFSVVDKFGLCSTSQRLELIA